MEAKTMGYEDRFVARFLFVSLFFSVGRQFLGIQASQIYIDISGTLNYKLSRILLHFFEI